MNGWRQFIAVAIAIAMLHLGVADMVRSAESTTVVTATAVKQKVEWFGAGAKVKVRLASGKTVNGSILAVENDAFSVGMPGSSGTSVAYEQVTELKLAKNTYKSKGKVDQDEVRRVVVELGVGKHVMAKRVTGEESHGNILTIDNEGFKMLPDRQSSAVEILYSETVQLGPNLSKGSKILIGVLVACAVVITVGVIVVASRDD
jgi:TRAP-type uncharacterized transport system fused permease subunit